MWASMVWIGLWAGGDGAAKELRQLKKTAIELREACDEGSLDRCMDLADMTRHGYGMDADKGGAAALYRQGCVSGRARGCVGLAELILGGEVVGDRAESIENLRSTCAGWDGSHEALQPLSYLEAQAVAMACVNRAHVYREAGISSRAKQLYRKACARDALGCFNAAAMIPADQEALAKDLTARACGLEDAAVAPTQVVGRSEMERGCHSLRTDGTLPADLGVAPKTDIQPDPRDGEKVQTVDFAKEVKVKKQGQVKISKLLAEGPMVEGTCRLHLVIDAKGKPYDVRVTACPAEAQELVETSGWGWRFEPVMMDDEPGPAQFELDVDVSFGLQALTTPEAASEAPPAEEAPAAEAPATESPPEEALANPAGTEEAPTTEEPASDAEAPAGGDATEE